MVEMDSELSQLQVQFLKKNKCKGRFEFHSNGLCLLATRDHNPELSQMLDVPHLLSTTKT